MIVSPASGDQVRRIELRRNLDDAAVRLALEYAERGAAWVVCDESEPVGIAVARDSEEERYVGDLFVEPSFRGQGLGTALLDAAYADAGDRARSMLVDSSDAASLTLAARCGLALREPLLRFAGAIPREEELAKMAAGNYRFDVAPVDPLGHAFGLRDLDRQTRGISRDGDHLYFSRYGEGYSFSLNGELVAYAYVWPDGRVGPIACASAAYLVQILGFALRAIGQRYAATWCTMLVPGTNLRVSRAALRARLRIEDTFVIAADSAQELATYVGYHQLLL